MSTEQRDPEQRDPEQLADRLIDQALREVLAAERPPDQSEKIIAAADAQRASVQLKDSSKETEAMSRRPRIRLAIAASLLLAVGGTVIVLSQSGIQEARRAAEPSPNHANDGVAFSPPVEREPFESFNEPLLQGIGTLYGDNETSRPGNGKPSSRKTVASTGNGDGETARLLSTDGEISVAQNGPTTAHPTLTTPGLRVREVDESSTGGPASGNQAPQAGDAIAKDPQSGTSSESLAMLPTTAVTIVEEPAVDPKSARGTSLSTNGLVPSTDAARPEVRYDSFSATKESQAGDGRGLVRGHSLLADRVDELRSEEERGQEGEDWTFGVRFNRTDSGVLNRDGLGEVRPDYGSSGRGYGGTNRRSRDRMGRETYQDGKLVMSVSPRIIVLEDEVDQLAFGTTPSIRDLSIDRIGRGLHVLQRPQAGEPGEGDGPGNPGDRYAHIVENDFLKVTDSPLSTFSIDVDTASYANMREYLMQHSTMPPADAVRIEELVNYFAYNYEPPADATASGEGESATPFAAHIEVAACPWQAERRLVRVGLKGREIDRKTRPPSNLVFLLDVSGSMDQPNKLPLLQRAMKVLVENLGENDRVAIVVYAGAAGLVLPSTTGLEKSAINTAIDQLKAGGSTAGGAGIRLAYQTAEDNRIEEGVNRVILCTDGDFNVGTTSPGELERLVAEKAKNGTFLTVLGFGRGNLNDVMMEAISNRGNGNYHYVDNMTEARKVLVEELSGTLVTIAKDVKIQIEFNPAQVAAYRLIGYENRVLAAQDFNDDKKDAGEIGAGHTVTALYEIVPVGAKIDTPLVDGLKYQQPAATSPTVASGEEESDVSGELLTLKLRYKQPDGEVSTKIEFPLTDEGQAFAQASDDFKFASAVASFGMLLRDSKYAGNATYDAVAEIAGQSVGEDEHGYRKEFLEIVERAKQVAGEDR